MVETGAQRGSDGKDIRRLLEEEEGEAGELLADRRGRGDKDWPG